MSLELTLWKAKSKKKTKQNYKSIKYRMMKLIKKIKEKKKWGSYLT